MKKIILVLTLLMVVVFVSGCNAVKPQPKKVTLNYWGLWEPETVMSSIINDYQKTHPNVTINYKKMSPQGYRETITTRIAEGTGPDIFRFHNTWLPMLRNELAVIPDKVMSKSEYEKTFYPITRKDLQISGQYYGIPLEIDSLALYINSDILKAAGETPPTTWKEFKELAEKLTTKDSTGKIQTAGAAIGTSNNVEHWSDILGLMLVQNGTDMTKVDNTILADGSNAGVDALSYYVSFAKGEKKVWDDTLDNSMIAFAQGKLAMFFGPHWQAFDIKALNPNINFIIVSTPQLSSSKVSWATYWVEGVSRKSANQQEAWNFLKFLSEKNEMQKLFTEQSRVRLYGVPPSRVDLADSVKNDQFVSVFTKEAPALTSWYMSSRTYDVGINDKIIQYFTDAVNGVYKESTTTKSALTTVANGIKTILEQYGLSVSSQTQK